jgi:hypothetical protein
VTRKGLSAVWRDAIRDSDLRATSKLVAYTLSTYANGRGGAYPARQTLARGSSLTVKAVDTAIRDLETGGFLEVARSRGRRTNTYCLTLPATANEVRRSEWSTANVTTANGERRSPNGERGTPKSSESVRKPVGGAQEGAPTMALDECAGCGKRRPLPDDIHCADCLADREAAAS